MSGDRGKDFRLHAGQSILAGLSHLLLDLLTGVLPLALLYPYLKVFRLPFGLLPSAGKIQLTNYLFYRNILIELGIFAPLLISSIFTIRDSTLFGKHRFVVISGFLVAACFIIWASTLSR